jgi:hypothetical protein
MHKESSAISEQVLDIKKIEELVWKESFTLIM